MMAARVAASPLMVAENGLDQMTGDVDRQGLALPRHGGFGAWCTVGFADWAVRLLTGERADWVARPVRRRLR